MPEIRCRRPLLCLALLFGVASAQEPLRFAHGPTLSPDGEQVAFAYLGDIWLASTAGGAARRLTQNPATEANPVWSPDGQWLAFGSDRTGNWDVWIMSSGGGEPRRLTFHPGADGASDFTPDSRQVLFASRRDGPALGPMRREYLVPVGGGTPRPLQAALGSVGRFSPNGRRLAFVRGASSSYRHGYRGPASEEIWIAELGEGRYRRLTDFAGPDTWPLWSADGAHVYFVSEQSGVRNLWAIDAAGGTPRQITFQVRPVRDPAISRDGRTIVYECDDRLWKLAQSGGQTAPIDLTVPADAVEPRELVTTRSAGITDYAVAPSGKEAAFVVRGDIYITRYPDGGPTRQLTDTPAEEGGLTWTQDSATLWFHSDREGHYELYSLTSGDEREPRLRFTTALAERRRTAGDDDSYSPQIAPDGQQITFVRGRGDIVVSDLELAHPKVISAHWSTPAVRWSPDSRWLAFSRSDSSFNWDVFLLPAAGGEPVNVSQHPRDDYAPVWSGDGSKLGFLSARNNDQVDAYFVWLRRGDWEQTSADRAAEADANYDPPKSPASQPPAPVEPGPGEPHPADPPAEPPLPPVAPPAGADEAPAPWTIDLDGIHERLVRLTSTIADERTVAASPDGKQFATASLEGSRTELFVADWNGDNRKQLTTSLGVSQVTWSPDGKQLRFLRDGGRLCHVAPAGGAVKTAEFEARIRRDLAAERAYLFAAVWRTMRTEFYDPALHGADWDAAWRLHQPRATAAPSRDEFDAVVNELLGELNASHTGFYESEPREASDDGVLGAEWAVADDGAVTVAAILPGSPAAREASHLWVGDQLVAIDGQRVGSGVNVQSLLLGTVEREVRLELRDVAGAERSVLIRPISDSELSQRRYDAFVKATRAEVERQSDGQVGYIHLREMSQDSLSVFERDLFAAANGKQALVLDVRWNSGGWTADHLLGMLMVRHHAYTVPRDGGRGYPLNRLLAPAWTGPTVLMANEFSISNAEILAHAFRTLGRGPVVGMPTYGGVISTGSTTLVDGSVLRLPSRGWYRVGDGLNLENHPAEPDVRIELGPADEAAGREPQLAAAVAAALGLKPLEPKAADQLAAIGSGARMVRH